MTLTSDNSTQKVVVDGVVLIFIDGMFGGHYNREDGTKYEHGNCVVCGEKINWISPADFAAYVCSNHDPPLIVHTPWCNDEHIERRELYQNEIDFINKTALMPTNI